MDSLLLFVSWEILKKVHLFPSKITSFKGLATEVLATGLLRVRDIPAFHVRATCRLGCAGSDLTLLLKLM